MSWTRVRYPKRAGELARYRQARAEREQLAGGLCEARSPVCPDQPHPGTHGHHIRPRSRGGPDTVANLRWVCGDAHRWVHSNPMVARSLGLLA